MDAIGQYRNWNLGENQYTGEQPSKGAIRQEHNKEWSGFNPADYELILSKEGSGMSNAQVRACTKEESEAFEKGLNEPSSSRNYSEMDNDTVKKFLASGIGGTLIIQKQLERGQALSFGEMQAIRAYAESTITSEMVAERKSRVDPLPSGLKHDDALPEDMQWIKFLPGLWGDRK